MKTVDYGDLRVGMTTTLDWVWDDSSSGSNRDGNIYNPHPAGDLLPIGSIGFRGHHNTEPRSGKRGVLLVGNVPGKSAACKHPTGYNLIWNDAGSGGKFDVSIWRPVAPDGYVAMGEYCSNSSTKPSVNAVWCIRQDYTADGKFGPSWWDDRGSGAKMNGSFWGVDPQNISLTGSEYVPIRTDTFYGKDSTHTVPPPASLAKTLRLYVGSNYQDWRAPLPTFTIATLPYTGQEFSSKEQASVALPYTVFFDPSDTRSVNKIADPFVSISRSCCWHVGGVWRNGGEGPFERTLTIEYGISEEKSKSLTESAGVSITQDIGVSAGPFSSSVSMSLNYQMTTASSHSRTEFSNKTVTEKFTVPAMTATAAFTRRMFYRSVRGDGSEVVADVGIDATDEVHFGSCKIPATASVKSD
ncbi:hypothetical protein DOTSEDRAFT_53114 [Dothistroma septosporum NZE10]|uniref:Uncharacterized protein n=1 Tax=Dothistroma septosporum (strain NZE10 / CBS 128990) TaxID=675120 RepID=N1PLB7_DOTSN|nr:hypothetical protein DOTSEDRAFT_53114 [Dothistroma septosporum NZE10]